MSGDMNLYDDSILVYRDKIHLDRIPIKVNETMPDPWQRLLTIEGDFTQHEYVPPEPCEDIPPPVPKLLFPENNGEITSLPYSFKWEAVNDNSTGGRNPCKYSIEIDNNSDFSSPEIKVSVLTD